MANRWIDQFMELVSGCWEWHALALRIGFQYHEPEDVDDGWEVWAYPAVQEFVGGKHDGETGWSGFNFDVFGFLEDVEFEALSIGTGLGDEPPQLVVECQFRGEPVLLHVCLEPLDGVEATEIVDLTGPEGPRVREKG
jgi:hypothetical protein